MKFLMLVLVLFVASCGKNEGPVPTGRIIERAKDPVCGMWVEKNRPNYQDIVIVFDNARYYFCCDACATTFTEHTTKYVTPCNCSKIKHDCACPHCQNKKEPCDCMK